ncbi:MAG TPA: hypothetical protein VN816_06230 [Acidimicrobiales bacterium]|nr:hypothetical protein [Acidimicrobiales bacterium]
MKRIGKFAVGGLVGTVLTLGIAGVAGAAPVTTTGATSTSTPSTSTPGTSTPSTSTPGTSTPGTSTPGTKSAPAKSTTLLGPAIWRAVEPRHTIDCARATKEIARIRTAMGSASQRQARWQKRSGRAQAHFARHATKKTSRHTKHASGKVKGYQKLQQEGTALIKRIDAKCGLTTPAG